MKAKNLILAVILICTAFLACKKSRPKDNSSEGGFDPKQYYILHHPNQWAKLYTFNASGKCNSYYPKGNGLAIYEPNTYQYKDGHIKIQYSVGDGYLDLTVANEQITNATTNLQEDFTIGDFGLYKIPKTDAFAGKTFFGNYYIQDNKQPGTYNLGGTTTISFRDGKWVSGGSSAKYNLINNAVAGLERDASGNIFFFTMINDKLYFYNIGFKTYGLLDETK